MVKLISKLEQLRKSLVALWDESFIRSEGEPKGFHKFLHFWVLVWRSFVRNRCPIRASALSYTTLLSLIPILAVAMSVSSMFLKKTGEKQIQEFVENLVNQMIPQFNTAVTNQINAAELSDDDYAYLFGFDEPAETMPPLVPSTNDPVDAFKEALSLTKTNEASAFGKTPGEINSSSNAPPPIQDKRVRAAQENFAEYIHAFIQRTNSGALGVTGMFFLLVTVILTLTRIEETFNDIWGVAHGRDWLTRVTNYVAAIVLGPALLGLAFALASGPRFEKTRDLLSGMPFISVLVSTILPFVVICFSFTLFYKLMPNTKVRFSAALVGGALAGTLWHVYNLLGFVLVSRAVNASKIYGGFALIPLFMGGLYIVWLTVLFGAQVAYAFQNRDVYLQQKLVEHVNQRGREFVALRLMTSVGQRFQRGQSLATVPEMSKELGIPSRLIQQVLQVLLNAHLVVEVSGNEPAYAPARPLEDITAHHVLMAMRATQGHELVTRDEPGRAEVYGEFARIQAAEKEAASAVSMLALVNRAQARVELLPRGNDLELPKMTAAFVPPVETVEPIEAESEHKPETSQPISSDPAPATSTSSDPEVSPAPIATPEEEERDFPL